MKQHTISKSLIRRLKSQVSPPPRTRRQIDTLISEGRLDEALDVLRRWHNSKQADRPGPQET